MNRIISVSLKYYAHDYIYDFVFYFIMTEVIAMASSDSSYPNTNALLPQTSPDNNKKAYPTLSIFHPIAVTGLSCLTPSVLAALLPLGVTLLWSLRTVL